MRHLSLAPILLVLSVLAAGCAAAGDAAGADGDLTAGDGDESGSATGLPGDGDTEGSGGSEGDGDGDGEQGDSCLLDCGQGSCALVDGVEYCDCPEGTQWAAHGCEPCPVHADAALDLDIRPVTFTGRFLLDAQAPPSKEYDDANLWLENARTGDRVHVGNTHDGDFVVRVTPGLYDVVYEVETAGDGMPRNGRARIGKVALFADTERDIEIPVAFRSGAITIEGEVPPKSEYDDASILFRSVETGDELLAGNTSAGSYSLFLVPGIYEVVYRVEDAGEVVPRNDGAVLDVVDVQGMEELLPIEIPSVSLEGEFRIAGAPAPASEYEDGDIGLVSAESGKVSLGNTHDQSYAINVIPDVYTVVYAHESGTMVPGNAHAELYEIDANAGGTEHIDVPMVQIAGVLTINGAAPPASEYDDGVLSLSNATTGDVVPLGNTHAGAYTVRMVPGSYDVIYSQETAGGGVPENKGARLGSVDVQAPMSVDIDVNAVQLSGAFTLAGQVPPSSQYENGRVYLRNLETGDSLVLGSTHEGAYAALVVPGSYELFYGQETGGAAVPGNQNASLGAVQIGAAMNLDVDIPMAELGGKVLLDGQPAPKTPGDAGQLYLRAGNGDAVYLGESHADSYGAKLVSGTYGVYYRATESLTMPENLDGRFACFTIP